MSNESGINPQGWRVLILPLEIETKTQSGIIVTTSENEEREQMANTTGQVIARGRSEEPRLNSSHIPLSRMPSSA